MPNPRKPRTFIPSKYTRYIRYINPGENICMSTLQNPYNHNYHELVTIETNEPLYSTNEHTYMHSFPSSFQNLFLAGMQRGSNRQNSLWENRRGCLYTNKCDRGFNDGEIAYSNAMD